MQRKAAMPETSDAAHDIAQNLPGSGAKTVPSILWFIFADTANFVLFFTVFMVERFTQSELFVRSAAMLDVRLGLLNTVILITSGWLVALAVASARIGNMAKVRLQLILAIGIGACFGVVKVFEYSAKISAGITLQTNLFFTYYYSLTGLHLLHLFIGLILLIIVLIKARTPTVADASFLGWITAAGLFWHMVDLLWVFLFAMFYLQGVA